MKIVLFVLGVLAVAHGCIDCDGPTPSLRHCTGTVEIKSELNGIEKSHGKLVMREGDAAPYKVRRMRYIPRMERASTKNIEVNGNCCWKFYNR